MQYNECTISAMLPTWIRLLKTLRDKTHGTSHEAADIYFDDEDECLIAYEAVDIPPQNVKR